MFALPEALRDELAFALGTLVSSVDAPAPAPPTSDRIALKRAKAVQHELITLLFSDEINAADMAAVMADFRRSCRACSSRSGRRVGDTPAPEPQTLLDRAKALQQELLALLFSDDVSDDDAGDLIGQFLQSSTRLRLRRALRKGGL